MFYQCVYINRGLWVKLPADFYTYIFTIVFFLFGATCIVTLFGVRVVFVSIALGFGVRVFEQVLYQTGAWTIGAC